MKLLITNFFFLTALVLSILCSNAVTAKLQALRILRSTDTHANVEYPQPEAGPCYGVFVTCLYQNC